MFERRLHGGGARRLLIIALLGQGVGCGDSIERGGVGVDGSQQFTAQHFAPRQVALHLGLHLGVFFLADSEMDDHAHQRGSLTTCQRGGAASTWRRLPGSQGVYKLRCCHVRCIHLDFPLDWLYGANIG